MQRLGTADWEDTAVWGLEGSPLDIRNIASRALEQVGANFGDDSSQEIECLCILLPKPTALKAMPLWAQGLQPTREYLHSCTYLDGPGFRKNSGSDGFYRDIRSAAYISSYSIALNPSTRPQAINHKPSTI